MAEAANLSPRMKKHYDEVVRPAMIEKFGYKNPFEVPTLDKIVLNMGVGEATADSKKPTVAAAEHMVARLGDAVSFYKIGMELTYGGGLEVSAWLIKM